MSARIISADKVTSMTYRLFLAFDSAAKGFQNLIYGTKAPRIGDTESLVQLAMQNAELEERLLPGVIPKLGLVSQSMMLMGECGELVAALNRCINQGRPEWENVVEELVDVEILIGQFRSQISPSIYERVKSQKLQKLNAFLVSQNYPDLV